LQERFAAAPQAASAVQAMAHRLKTPEGRRHYALCKQMPEPVFGIIKGNRLKPWGHAARRKGRRARPSATA
jgi:hypothetical protein